MLSCNDPAQITDDSTPCPLALFRPSTGKKKSEKGGMDSQVLLLEERNFLGLDNNFCTGLSACLCTRPATIPWAHGLTPWGCYFSMCNVGHLRLGSAFGITGLLDA